ncbi:hypothetical protein ACWPM1_02135 [Tsuneonella sp. HG249]
MKKLTMAAVAASALALPANAQTLNPGTTVSGGVVTLDARGQAAGTSHEIPNLNLAVENGDVISFEYKGPCGGGAPRVFIQGGAYNTFDQDPNGSACGTDTDGDGWFTVTETITGITSGAAGQVGIVNNQIANPDVIQVRNLTIDGQRINLATGGLGLANADQCKNDGWQAAGFRNQGDCVSSFKSNRPDNR